MKKKLLLGFISLFCLSAFAEEPDLILTKYRFPDKIEAKIDTISEYEVFYREWKDSSKQVKKIGLEDVKGIIYSTGKTKFYNITEDVLIRKRYAENLAKRKKVQEEKRRKETKLAKQELEEEHQKYKDLGLANPEENEYEKDLLTQIGKNYYLGGKRIDKDECSYILRQSCPIAYKQFTNANKKANASWTSFGIGLGFEFIGGLVLGLANTCPDVQAATISGGFFCFVGGVTSLVSLPIACVQTARRCDALNTYNTAILAKKVAELKFNANSDGSVGIALEF